MDFKLGYSWEVVEFAGESEILERIQELGIRHGSVLKLLHAAPFGGPKLFQTGSSLLALRAEELACLKLKSV